MAYQTVYSKVSRSVRSKCKRSSQIESVNFNNVHKAIVALFRPKIVLFELHSLNRTAVEMLYGGLIVVLFEGCKTSSSIILRAPTPLFVAEVLSCIRCEEA